jgi:hypothetical protein
MNFNSSKTNFKCSLNCEPLLERRLMSCLFMFRLDRVIGVVLFCFHSIFSFISFINFNRNHHSHHPSTCLLYP